MNSNSCICKCIWDHSHCVNTWHTAYINCSTQTSKHCRVIMNMYINATNLMYVMSNISSWGIRHETTAKEKYIESESSKHLSFGVTPTGFYICITWWEGVLWLLWLWVLGDQMSLLGTRQDTIRTVKKRDFYLVGSSPRDGTLKLDRKQLLQCQLHVTQSPYCDFCVWTPTELHIERITPDANLESYVIKTTRFFKYAVLPELLGKWFSQNGCSSEL